MTLIRIVQQTDVIRITVPSDEDTTTIKISGIGVQGPAGTRRVDLVYNISGSVPANRTILGYVASGPVTLYPADAVAVAETANDVDCTISIVDLANNPIGTVFFAAASLTGVVTVNPYAMVKGNGLKFVHPANVTTLSDINVTLPANR